MVSDVTRAPPPVCWNRRSNSLSSSIECATSTWESNAESGRRAGTAAMVGRCRREGGSEPHRHYNPPRS